MSQISLSIGERSEEYEIFEKLGEGGFAKVHRARCKKSGFEVALKMIDRDIINKSTGMVDRVKQEVAIHSKLKHPSILELYTFFEDENYVYLVLELARHGELHRYLKESQRVMKEAETANILTQVVNGLLYLKARNIIHRDMSLSNLLLTDNLKVKISDFGLATKLARPDQKHLTLCGTPNYISPEVATRASHGLPVDVWGLGCMMYTMLVGTPPFDTDGVKQTLTRVVRDDFVMPTHLSMDAQDLLRRLLRKNPIERIHIDDVLCHPFMEKHIADAMHYNMNTIASVDSGLITMSSGALSTQHLTGKNGIFDQCSTRLDANIKRPNVLNTANGNASEHNLYYQNGSDRMEDDGIANCFDKIDLLQKNGAQYLIHRDGLADKQPMRSNNAIYGNAFAHQREHGNQENQNTPVNGQRFQHILPKPQNCILNGLRAEKISVPPLSSMRLMPTRHKTRSAILTILSLGEVVVELIKFKSKYNEERVVDVCRISSDGLRIVIYQPDAGRGSKIQDCPPDLPESGADSIYSYENLPSKHWKKYTYAYRFVQMVRGKTPKVTYYSSQAKCQLMETLDDFEAAFYDGTTITKSSNGQMKVTDEDGRQLDLARLTDQQDVMCNMNTHFQQCLEHCQHLERLLRDLRTEGECFPIIVGRRPAIAPVLSSYKEYNTNMMTPRLPNMSSFASSVLSSRPQSVQSKSSPIFQMPPADKVIIPGIGIASQSLDGVLEVTYVDGSRLSVIQREQGGGITFTQTNGIQSHYTETDSPPETVRERLFQIPTVFKHLMTHNAKSYQPSPLISSSGAYACTPINRKCVQQQQPPPAPNMKYFR